MSDIATASLGFASGIAATAVGAFIVHKLTRSREHDIWVRDCRIKEWQELLDSLTRAYMTLLSSTTDFSGEAMAELERKKQEGLADVDIVLSTRIFIADDITNLDIRMKWAALVTDYRRGQSSMDPMTYAESKQIFKNRFQGLRKSIVEAARQTK